MVMEYLTGESLQARLRRLGRLPFRQAAQLTRHITDALAAAHGRGIVHRDLKPDNIFVVSDPGVPGGERTKVFDFGIAKLMGEMASSVKTQTDLIMGTPAYMAPEQCKGAALVDHRADLYSLGCIMFEMLCGRRPFLASGAGEVMAQQIYTPPPSPRQLEVALPAPLEAMVLRLLAKEPEQRHQSAGDLLGVLDQYLATGDGESSSKSTPTVPATPKAVAPTVSTTLGGASVAVSQSAPERIKRSSRTLIPLALVLVLLGAGGMLALTQRGDANSQGSYSTSTRDTASQGTAAARAATTPPSSVDGASRVAIPGEGSATKPAAAESLPADGEPRAPLAREPERVQPHAQTRIEIDSDPPGAEIYRQPSGLRVGKTPHQGTFEAAAGEHVFLLRKRGYQDATVVIPAQRDGRETVVLEPIRRHKNGSSGQGNSDRTPAKSASDGKPEGDLHSGGSLNPFGD
jgi:serine/threonine-protein kinase